MPSYTPISLADNRNASLSRPIRLLLLPLLATLLFGASHSYAEDAQTVDLNAANALKLIEIDTISISLASAIVRYREQNGPFSTAQDLLAVPGMTENSLKHLQLVNDGKGGLIATLTEEEYTDNNMELPNY